MAKKDDIKKLVDSGKYKLEDIEDLHHAKLKAMAKELDEEEAKDEEEEESVIPTRSANTRKSRAQFDNDRLVPIISATNSNVFYSSLKSGYSFDLQHMGDYDEIPFGELVQMNNRHPRYLKYPFIILLDEEIADHFKLDYTNVFQDEEELDAYLDLSPERIEKTFDKLSKSSKKLLVSHVSKKIKNNESIDLRKVNVLEKITGLDLTE